MIVPDSGENGVLVFVDADRRADIDALCRWENAGLLKGAPERLAEARFVVLLEPGVHDIVNAVER